MKRDWKDAEVKRGPCRVCSRTDGVELAHVTERANDKFLAMDQPVGGMGILARVPHTRTTLPVSPLRVVPLCGRFTNTNCHGSYDDHLLDLTPFLSREEAAQAVLDVGFENARIRISGSRSPGQSVSREEAVL